MLLCYLVFPFVAFRINCATSFGCDTGDAWLEGSEIVVAFICFANIIASILSSQPLPSPMMRYIAHRLFIIHSFLRYLFLLSPRKVSLSEKIDARLLDLQVPNKERIGSYIIMSWKHALFDMDINIENLDIAIFQVLFVISLKTFCYHNSLLVVLIQNEDLTK